jgi:hypothetical protein
VFIETYWRGRVRPAFLFFRPKEQAAMSRAIDEQSLFKPRVKPTIANAIAPAPAP